MKKILVAEDERPMAKALELKLVKAGYEVVVVHTGLEALTALGNNQYDLVLLDVLMPEMNGFEVLEQLTQKPKVIITSNLGQPEDIEKARKLGAIDYLVKSNVSLLDIVQKVESVIGH